MLPLDASRRQIVSGPQCGFEQEQWARRLCQKKAVFHDFDVTSGLQDVNTLVRVFWMAVDGYVFFKPLIDCSEVDFDQILECIGLEDDEAVSGEVADGQVAKMSSALGEGYRRRLFKFGILGKARDRNIEPVTGQLPHTVRWR